MHFPARQLLRFTVVLALVVLSAIRSNAQRTVREFVEEYASRGRNVSDLAVDAGGSVHVAWLSAGGAWHEPGTLFYTRLDRSGTSVAETQVTRYGDVEHVRMDVGPANNVLILYHQVNRLCCAAFDTAGVMQTEMDRHLTQEETDALFDVTRDESGGMIVFGRGALDYFWRLDPAGKVLAERRGRWLRIPTPGFICHLVNPTTLLLIWPARRDGSPGNSGPGANVQSLKFNLTTFSHGDQRTHTLGRAAEAKDEGTMLSSPQFVRSGGDAVLLVSARDSTGGSTAYRLRFNNRGDVVRRWEMKKVYHLTVASPLDAHCALRPALVSTGRAHAVSPGLQGVGRDGNIYHFDGKLDALKTR
jgi:hypothetical protein